MKFRIAKNGHGMYCVQRECATPGDIDGGTRWERWDEALFTSLERAREHRRDCEEEHADYLLKTTWEPVE